MLKIEERERNLINATDTLAQFYDEIESFLGILLSSMTRAGYSLKAERLRSGTFTAKNLYRRLLATATVVYLKGIGPEDEGLDEEEPDDLENDEELDADKAGKAEVAYSKGLKIPFVNISLFPPKTMPSANTLSSPMLRMGALGDIALIEKKTGQPATPDSPVLSLTDLAQMPLKPTIKKGDIIRMNCWRPKKMKKYKMEGKLIGLESQKLLEIDSQEKIKKISETLIAFCE